MRLSAARRTASLAPMPGARGQRAITVRRARVADHGALLALEQRCFTGDRLSARALRHHLGNPRAWFAIAARGDAVLGDALLFFRHGSAQARLYSIAVAPEAQGLGLGARLLGAAERAARRRGRRVLGLEVRVDNPAAIALYERRGYRRVGRRARYYADGADAWRYVKALSTSR